MDGFEFTKAELNIARDFAGIVGRVDLSRLGMPSSHIVYLTPDIPSRLGPFGAPGASWSVQMLRSGAPEYPPPVDKGRRSITTWAGSIWHVPAVNKLDEVSACNSLLSKAVCDADLTILRRIDGDFVAAVITSEQVVLLRSLTSTTMLFYRVCSDTIQWSTNFMDLVDDPFDDMDRDVLAFVTWGGNAIPYPGIETLLPGEFVRFNARGVVREQFDDYERPGYPRQMSLAEWGESARELIQRSVARRARPFRRVGLLLSGGMDSSAIARCLVDAGADVRCYNWASPSYPPADESRYARSVAEHLGIPLTSIDIGGDRFAGSRFLDEGWEFSVPYNHGLYRWWHEAVQIAKQEVDCLMTGRFGDGFCGRSELNLFADLATIEPLQGVKFFLHSLSVPTTTARLLSSFLPSPEGIKLFVQSLPLPVNMGFLRNFLRRRKTDLSPWRQIYHFTEEAQQAISMLKDQATSRELLQSLALDNNTLRPAGLVHISPFLDRDIMCLVKAIPSAYRLLPYGGQVINKPVLRWAFLDLLPPEVVRRNYQRSFSAITQWYCLNNKEFLRRLFSRDAYLVKYGIVDYRRFLEVLEDRRKVQMCANTIIRSAMVELWLKSLSRTEVRSC